MTATAAPAATPAPAPTHAKLALPVLLLGAMLISFSAIFVKASELGPVATGFYRMFLALPVFAVWMGHEASGRPLRYLPRRWGDWWMFALCGLFLAADLGIWNWSARLTSAANATLLGTMAPIYVTLVGFLFFGQRFHILFLLGLAMAIVGAGLLLGVSFHLGGRPFLGDLLAMSVAVLYAGYLMTLSQLRRRFSTAMVMALSGVFTCLALLIVVLISGEAMLPATLRGWLILFALALMSQVAAQSAIAWALAHLRAAFGAVALLLTPVATALFAWPILGEAIGPLQALGGLTVLAGIALARLGSQKRKSPAG